VSIGTHDLDTIQGPFSYEALPPEQIKFVPLKQDKEMNAKELMEFYEVSKNEMHMCSTILTLSRKTSISDASYTSFATHLSTP